MVRARPARSAPKGLAKVTAAAAAKRVTNDMTVGSTCMERLETGDGTPKPLSKKARSRTPEQAMQKVLNDNFYGFSDEELYLNRVQGMTLPERLQSDRAKATGGEKLVFGKLYYSMLRSLYRASASDEARLQIEDDTQPIDESLVEAIVAASEGRKVVDGLISWSENVTELNQMNCIGVFKQVLKMPPTKGLDNLQVGIAMAKMALRLKLTEQYPKAMSCMRSYFDQVGCKSLQLFKAQQQSGGCWWATNKAWAKLVLPEVATDRAFGETCNLSAVSKEISVVVESSELGRRLLAAAQRQVSLDAVAGLITEHVAKMESGNIDQARLDNEKAAFLKAMKTQGVDPLARHIPKEETFMYRGVPVKVVVASPLERYTVAVQSYIRTCAADAGALHGLWCENDLLADRPKVQNRVQAGCISETSVARRTLMEQLTDDEATGDNILRVFAQKKAFLTTVDRWWKIEFGFWCSLTGDEATKSMENRILESLTCADRPMTLEDSDAKLAHLEESKLAAFSGPALTTIVKAVRGYVQQMLHGRTLVLDRLVGTTDFAATLKARLALFCTFVPAGASGSNAAKLTGTAAATSMFKQLVQKHKGNEAMNYGDIVPMLSFSWLLNADEQTALNEIKNDIVAKGGAMTDTKSKVRSKVEVDTRAMVKALFKK